MKKLLALLALAFLPSLATLPTICVHCWYKIPNSRLDSSGALPGTIPAPGGSAYKFVFEAWGGAAFDADSNRLLVTGGGHSDYSGNEVYGFSMDSLKWFLVKAPSSVVTHNPGSEYYDNPPDSQQLRSQHSRNRLQTCPGRNELFYLAMVGMYPEGDDGNGIHKLNLLTKVWSRPDTLPFDVGNGVPYTNGTSPISGYDSVTDRIWYHGMKDGHSWLFSIRCSDDSLAQNGGYWTDDLTDLGNVNEGTGAVDVKRRRLYNFGQTRARYWDLTSPGTASVHTSFTPTGNLTIYNAASPGLDYSYVDTTLVGYAGGDTVYSFNSVSHAWSAVAPSASNTVHPPAQQANGTFGRFRYVKAGNYFIYAHSADSAVYLYRLSAETTGGGSSTSFRKTLLGVGN